MPDSLFPILGTDIPQMIGRAEIMRRIISDLTKPSPSHLSVVGPRYSGKSVLLKAVSERMSGTDSPYQVVILWDLGHQIPDSDSKFINMLRHLLANALREDQPDYSAHLRDLDDDYGSLREILELMGDEGIKVLMLWDGFDKPLGSGLLTRNLWDQLRELASLPSLRLLTATRRPLNELIRSEESATSDFWNIFDMSPVRVGVFDEEDRDTILSQIPDIHFESSARKELQNWTAGYPPLLLGLLNQVISDHASGSIENSKVNQSAEHAREHLQSIIESLWHDCPAGSQDLYRDLSVRKSLVQASVSRENAAWLLERGFAESAGNKITHSCRFLEQYLDATQLSSSDMAHLFGTWDDYSTNIRGVLERRLGQLTTLDDRLRRLVARAIEDIPDFPDDCLNNLTHIEEVALDVIWQREFGDDKILPQEVWDEWKWVDAKNNTVIRLKDFSGKMVPNDRALQCGMLQLLTGSRQGFRTRAAFATKDTYVLINAIHSFRNRNQHAGGEKMHSGVAVAALMICLELLACLDR